MTSMKSFLLPLIALFGLSFAITTAPAQTQAPKSAAPLKAIAVLHPTADNKVGGTVTFTEEADGVRVQAEQALQELQRATDLLQDLEANPDGTLHLKVATRRLGEASEAYRRALRALSNHVLSQPPGVAMAAHRVRPSARAVDAHPAAGSASPPIPSSPSDGSRQGQHRYPHGSIH